MKVNQKTKIGVLIALVVLVIQLFSLFRSLPSVPACGKIQSLGHGARVLINCDSAVFMKDAQNPMRFFNGESVYQDRPLYASLNWLIATPLTNLGVPNKKITVIGNSGVPTEYSEIFYLSYLLINFIVLLLAAFFMFKWVQKKNIFIPNNFLNVLIVTNLIFILTANELTKTFFWTPHSQMFNLLLPCYALYLGTLKNEFTKKRTVFLHAALIGAGLLFYSLLIILFYFILFNRNIKIRDRIFAIGVSVIPWISFPFLVTLLGGNYRSIAFSKYREFIWLVDGIRNHNFLHVVGVNGMQFLRTIPLIPICLMVLASFILLIEYRSRLSVKALIGNDYVRFFLLYATFFAILGYYARRVTLGPIIFLELITFVSTVQVLKVKEIKNCEYIYVGLLILQASSWLFTHGPMQ